MATRLAQLRKRAERAVADYQAAYPLDGPSLTGDAIVAHERAWRKADMATRAVWAEEALKDEGVETWNGIFGSKRPTQ